MDARVLVGYGWMQVGWLPQTTPTDQHMLAYMERMPSRIIIKLQRSHPINPNILGGVPLKNAYYDVFLVRPIQAFAPARSARSFTSSGTLL